MFAKARSATTDMESRPTFARGGEHGWESFRWELLWQVMSHLSNPMGFWKVGIDDSYFCPVV